MDVEVLAGLGPFFADKFRAGVARRWYERPAEPTSLGRALIAHHTARDAWQRAADAVGASRADISFGRSHYAPGYWTDRLPAFDEDLAALTHHAAYGDCLGHADRSLTPAPDALGARRVRPGMEHVPPAASQKGEQLALSFTAPVDADLTVFLHYGQMAPSASWLVAPQPGMVTEPACTCPPPSPAVPTPPSTSPKSVPAGTALHSRLGPDHLANQPYGVVHAQPRRGWGVLQPSEHRCPDTGEVPSAPPILERGAP